MYRTFVVCLLVTAACAPVQSRSKDPSASYPKIEAPHQVRYQSDLLISLVPEDSRHFLKVSDGGGESLGLQIFAGLNQERTQAGLAPLSFSRELATAALEHSVAMAQRGIFEHRLDGEADLFTRVKGSGLATDAVGENLFATDDQEPASVAEDCVKAWMLSPGHRENMLSSAFARTGIAVDRGSDGLQYITADFAH